MSQTLPRWSAVTVLVAAVAWSWDGGGFGGAVDAPVETTEASAQASWNEADLWLAPAAEPIERSPLALGIDLLAVEQPADALPYLAKALADDDLGPYARLYVGRAHLAVDDHARAIVAARQIIESFPAGHLGESARWLLAESHEGAGEWADAVKAWQGLAAQSPKTPAAVHLRLAQAAEKAGQPQTAGEAYRHIYYEWPTSEEAAAAQEAIRRYPTPPPGPATFARELARAERLYGARRFADARRAFEPLATRATGDDRGLVALRLAQCDVGLQRHARALEALTSYLRGASGDRRVEAEYTVLAALRGLRRADYPARVDRFVRDHPESPLAERALNELATHYILANDDSRAAEVFTSMYARYPLGAFADRAAWRAGWWAYRQGNLNETIRLFETASSNLRRADYRPSWLYWTARSYARLKQHDTARLWYLRTIADYRHSYYGREAIRALAALPGGDWTDADVAALRDPSRAIVAGVVPAGTARARQLLAAGLWDDAIAELRQVPVEPSSASMIEATVAYALNRKGELRPGITAMRRAYPQFMSDGGETLPERMRRVIFPVAYSELIWRYADDRQLDRHLVTALVAQESTFQADVRSAANAWGLMQLLPSTGRRYATRVGVTGFSTARLTDPETNVRLGTAYLSDLLARFKDVAQALAAYNAGENRVERWRSERPGVPRDEFIDDIPFPETQNYVKRIIGTAEDYRLLYASTADAIAGPAPR